MITCYYSCRLCGLLKQPVQVRARTFGEDVVYYVQEVVGNALAFDHQTRSPGCHPDKLSDVMVPAPEQGIGYEEMN